MKAGRLYAVVIVLLVVVTVISLRFWQRKPIHHLHSGLPAVTVSPVLIEVQGQKFVREQQTLWQVSKWNFAHSQLTVTNTDRHDRQITVDSAILSMKLLRLGFSFPQSNIIYYLIGNRPVRTGLDPVRYFCTLID